MTVDIKLELDIQPRATRFISRHHTQWTPEVSLNRTFYPPFLNCPPLFLCEFLWSQTLRGQFWAVGAAWNHIHCGLATIQLAWRDDGWPVLQRRLPKKHFSSLPSALCLSGCLHKSCLIEYSCAWHVSSFLDSWQSRVARDLGGI